MAIKPSPTIAGKLRKLFNNNKQTIEPAIGDSIPGGSGGGAYIVNVTYAEDATSSSFTCDKTAGEMAEAFDSGKCVFGFIEDEYGTCKLLFTGYNHTSDRYSFFQTYFTDSDTGDFAKFKASAEDDYPFFSGAR